MGLDAFVPCNCFEKGRLPKPPDPFEVDDLFRDEDGCISSHKLWRRRFTSIIFRSGNSVCESHIEKGGPGDMPKPPSSAIIFACYSDATSLPVT